MIRIISLPKSNLRKQVENQLKGMPYKFFDACVLKDREHTFNFVKAKEKYKRDIRLAEAGCSISHMSVYKELIANNEEFAFVFEDDVLVEDKQALTNLYYNYEANDEPQIILLGHSKTRKKDLWIQRLKQPLSGVVKINSITFGSNDRVSFCGAVGYVINRNAAEIILKESVPYWIADDWSIFNRLGIKILHAKYPLVYEDLKTESTTDNEIMFNHSLAKEPLRQILSIVKSQIIRLLSNIYEKKN